MAGEWDVRSSAPEMSGERDESDGKVSGDFRDSSEQHNKAAAKEDQKAPVGAGDNCGARIRLERRVRITDRRWQPTPGERRRGAHLRWPTQRHGWRRRVIGRRGGKFTTNKGFGRGPRGDKRRPGSTNGARGRGVPVWPEVPLLLGGRVEVAVMVAKARKEGMHSKARLCSGRERACASCPNEKKVIRMDLQSGSEL